jgi:hypothetical protein
MPVPASNQEGAMDQTVKVNWKELAQAADHWLLLFDSSFAHDDVPLHARPLTIADRRTSCGQIAKIF